MSTDWETNISKKIVEFAAKFTYVMAKVFVHEKLNLFWKYKLPIKTDKGTDKIGRCAIHSVVPVSETIPIY